MAISELRVPNASNVVALIGKSVPPEQWRRELLENARHAGASKVLFDGWLDPESGRQLMRVSDDGCGMNPRTLQRRIRDLADPLYAETYGIGGRIATATVSPAGVAWASREEDAPAAMVVMKRERNRWGLEQFADEDDRVAITVEPVAGMLPRLAAEHGTSVVLYGDGRHDSWRPSEAHAIGSYLVRRYWTFGETAVHVQGWRSGGAKSQNERVPDTRELLDRYTEAKGVVTLADGSEVHWFRVTDPRVEGGKAAAGYRPELATGLAVLHGDELYDRGGGGRSQMRLARFGLFTRAAQARVVLIIHPHPDLGIEPNAERTRLVQPHGRDLPWQEWARSFFEQLPAEIAQLLPQTPTLDLEQLQARFGNEWRERIRPVPRPVRTRGGPDQGMESTLELAATLEPIGDQHEDDRTDEKADAKGPVEAPETTAPEKPAPKRKPVNIEADGHTRARKGRRHDVPHPKPIDPEDWPHGDYMDYAYIETLNELHYKTTGEAIDRQTRYWAERRDDVDQQLVAETVQAAYAVEMVGKILHVLDVYAGREGWMDPLEEVLSPRALTFASLGFHAVDAMIEEQLRLEELAEIQANESS